jgi:hypothetical protein
MRTVQEQQELAVMQEQEYGPRIGGAENYEQQRLR